MLDIIIATRNRHKLREITRLIAVPGIRWHSLADYPGLRPVKESGRTFDANAGKKARAVARTTGHLALADDSGIEVEALGSGPGVRSARFAGRHGDDEANNRKLLRALRGLPPSRRRARYRCSLALAEPSGVIVITHGTWDGRIASRMAGRGGFGYDPVFLVPRLGKTVGQLPAAVKATFSHRAMAARRMRPILRQLTAARRRTGSAGNRPGRGRAA